MTMLAPALETPGRIRPLTRTGIWILFVLALANGVFLYCFPSQAFAHYAWAIKPPVNAAFIGAGFLAGTLATGLVLFATTRWRNLQTLPPALWVLATLLALATAIHNDKFKFDYPPTWVWSFVYAAVPFAVPYLVIQQNRSAEPVPEADPALLPVRLMSALSGTLLLAGAAALYIAPVAIGKHWLWTLTPLLARAVAAWYALIGTILVSCAVGLRQASEALIPYATILAWSVLLALLPVLHSGDVDTSGGAFVLYLVVLADLVMLSLLALARAVPAARDL